MSSSIAIPKRKQPNYSHSGFSSSSSSSYASSAGNNSPQASSSAATSSSSTPSTSVTTSKYMERRPSLLGPSLSKSEYTVVNVGSPEMPRLITCVKASQGFDWNQDMFLPSYASDYDSSDLEHKADPVQDIILTDEEAAALLPQ